MISSNLLKTGALLCIISLSSISGASLPDNDPLHAKLAAIDAMSDEDTFCAVVPLRRDRAEPLLVENKAWFVQNKNTVAELSRAQAKLSRLDLKHCATDNELEACNDPERCQKLIDKKNQIYVECEWHLNEKQVAANKLLRGGAPSAMYVYNHLAFRFSTLSIQASILRAQKEDENKAAQQRETQWQQENQALEAELRGYKLLLDGQQIEGMPNIPGGIQPQEGAAKHKGKRSSSCER